jgi:hypothetical protein
MDKNYDKQKTEILLGKLIIQIAALITKLGKGKIGVAGPHSHSEASADWLTV